MRRYFCSWHEQCPNCGTKMKYRITEEAGPQSNIDHYQCPKCLIKLQCQIWENGRYQIYPNNFDAEAKEIDLSNGKVMMIFRFDSAITSYLLEHLEDKFAALLEREEHRGQIKDMVTGNITTFPLSDEYKYPPEIQELRSREVLPNFTGLFLDELKKRLSIDGIIIQDKEKFVEAVDQLVNEENEWYGLVDILVTISELPEQFSCIKEQGEEKNEN